MVAARVGSVPPHAAVRPQKPEIPSGPTARRRVLRDTTAMLRGRRYRLLGSRFGTPFDPNAGDTGRNPYCQPGGGVEAVVHLKVDGADNQ